MMQMASRMPGRASSTSMARMMGGDSVFSWKAATRPSATPGIIDINTDNAPMVSEMRAPNNRRDRRQRPSSSVPSG